MSTTHLPGEQRRFVVRTERPPDPAGLVAHLALRCVSSLVHASRAALVARVSG